MNSLHKLLKSGLLISLFILVSCQEKGKHVFILSGQSNMVRMNPKLSFTPKLEAEFGKENIIVVKDAMGAQPISRWYKNWKSPKGDLANITGDLYDRLMTKVSDSIKNQQIASITFIWMQGERDARMEFASVYEESLLGIYQQLSTDLNRSDINFIIGRLSDFDMENKKWPHWTKIRDIQEKVGNSNSNFKWVNTDDLNTGLDNNGKEVTDDLHLSAEGYKILGTRFAEESINLINKKE
ncbi:sialate O-acetylesterase [Polaribacter litorisediminis]|uniref:sialate O-acetylesterase n=1 Tax=Polaribacter litorisediminis TaxID=1908341 RepID=UPI001CBACFF4|nr:sialate O-acetylesterase [Polaribacter litorisediminis]UAM97985.1 sialate O-acetylesterase [Polaribacter litorisediminis]